MLLAIRNLTVSGTLPLDGVSIDLDEGRSLGLLGVPGAGKSLLLAALLDRLRPPARLVGGSMLLAGRDLLAMRPHKRASLLGSRIGVVVNSPLTALDPSCRIGDQLVRTQQAHARHVSRAIGYIRAADWLRNLGVADAGACLRAWPHEISVAIAYRVVLAMALINFPPLLVADEPTGGLGSAMRPEITELLSTQIRLRRIGAIIASRDPAVIRTTCDDVAVLSGGRIVEQGAVSAVFAAPWHPATRRLLAAAAEPQMIHAV
jgi:ABC-type glutathione transport system ATPase component